MATKASSYPVDQLNESIFISISNERYGGYKLDVLKQNLTPIEEKFVICPSCTGIMKNASFSAGKNMCESCCPETEKSTPVESVRETVNKLPCRCPLDTNGCGWTGVIGELETHLSVCEHLMVPCPFVDYGCEAGLVRRLEMQLHLKEFSTQHIMGRILKVEGENRKLEQESKKAFSEIDFLKKENRKAFEKIDILTKENSSLRENVNDLNVAVFICPNLRFTLGDKELHGFQFTIIDIKERLKSSEILPGPMTYLKKYKLQVHYKLTTGHVRLYFMRIPGMFDAELEEAYVRQVYYQVIDSVLSKMIFDSSKNIDHPLDINKMSPLFAYFDIKDKVINNDALTIRLFF